MAVVIQEEVRLSMRDFLARNDLLQRVEFSDSEIDHALKMVIDKFNSMTPISDFGLGNFPSKYIIIKGAISELLMAEAIAQNRNSLSYQDGGISVNVDDKAGLYMQMAQSAAAEFEKYSEDLKKQINVEGGFGGVHSPYRTLPIL